MVQLVGIQKSAAHEIPNLSISPLAAVVPHTVRIINGIPFDVQSKKKKGGLNGETDPDTVPQYLCAEALSKVLDELVTLRNNSPARFVGTGLSVARGDTASHGERVRRSDFGSGCGHGSTDGERALAQLDSAVEAWRAVQESETRSVSSTGSANLDVVASAGSFLLCACAGSVKLFMFAVGSTRIAPHIHSQIVRHWFGAVKNFPRVDQLLRVSAPGSPTCVARGGNLTAELA